MKCFAGSICGRCASANPRLREGMMADYLSRHLPDLSIRREVPDPRRRSVLDLARRCDWHQSHSEQVARLCMEFFDQTKPLHKLTATDRELIEYATLLHDIGWHIGRERHHKHSMYLILHGGLKNFTREEIRIIANIARYHRKVRPEISHREFAKLSAHGQRVVQIGAGLLRIADGLDRSHSSVVGGLKTKLRKKRIDISVKARGDAELEIWGARNKSEMLEEVLERTTRITQSR